MTPLLAGLSTEVADCLLHGPADHHRPRPFLYDRHHVILESWTTALKLPQSRLVPLCPTGHVNVHAALRDRIAGRPYAYHVSKGMAALVDEAYGFWFTHQEALSGHAISGLEVV